MATTSQIEFSCITFCNEDSSVLAGLSKGSGKSCTCRLQTGPRHPVHPDRSLFSEEPIPLPLIKSFSIHFQLSMINTKDLANALIQYLSPALEYTEIRFFSANAGRLHSLKSI